jgi:hypothetical protein
MSELTLRQAKYLTAELVVNSYQDNDGRTMSPEAAVGAVKPKSM